MKSNLNLELKFRIQVNLGFYRIYLEISRLSLLKVNRCH